MPTRITEELAPYFTEAFEKYPEITHWDISYVFLPDAVHNQFAAYLGLYAEIPGSVLDTTIRYTALLSPSGQTEETVHEHAREAHRILVEGRSQQIEQMVGQQEQALGNGQPTPSGGLILPESK